MKKSPFEKITYKKNAEVYKLMANAKRLEILNLLKAHKEVAVGEMIGIMKLPKANISQHLSILRRAKLIRARQEGLNVYYTIIDPEIVAVCAVLRKLRNKKIIP